MGITCANSLVDLLRECQLVDADQSIELARLGEAYSGDARALAHELIQRGWLTPYQVNQLLRGMGRELLVSPYVLLDRLGEGGTGQVFKARHCRLGRIVALKLIRRELLTDSEVVKRFLREIKAVSRLSHPNIVHAFDAGSSGSTHFLAMEYLEGIDLARLVQRSGPLPVEQVCDFIRQAALGLQYAHEQGLVHRDIKPPNLFLVSGGRKPADDSSPSRALPSGGLRPPLSGVVKLLDLGLARLQRKTDSEMTSILTQTDGMIGTPDYLAPEQALDFHQADIRADIYSLGCTCYYLLTGQPPFPGGSLAEKLMRHQQAEPPPLDRQRSDVPACLASVVRTMMAKHPDQRYPTPIAVVHALDEVSVSGKRARQDTSRLTGSKLPAKARRRMLFPGRSAILLAGGAVLATALLVALVYRPEVPAPGTPASTPAVAGQIRPGHSAPLPARVVVLPQSSPDWRFLPAAAVKGFGDGWRAVEFDDRAWRTGKAPLGHGEPEIARRGGTTIPEMGVPFVFRRTFEVAPELLTHKGIAFRLCVASDDSAVVYLNGVLVDEDPIADHEFKYWNRMVELSPGLFKPGRNLIAAFVKNHNGSSDIYLDMELTVYDPAVSKTAK
jgi:serine/threonine-protein kinase